MGLKSNGEQRKFELAISREFYGAASLRLYCTRAIQCCYDPELGSADFDQNSIKKRLSVLRNSVSTLSLPRSSAPMRLPSPGGPWSMVSKPPLINLAGKGMNEQVFADRFARCRPNSSVQDGQYFPVVSCARAAMILFRLH